MEYNIVAIDPSLISTAMVVSCGDSFKIYNYCRESAVYKKTGMTKWFKLAEQFVEYKFVEYREFKEYSDGELIKLKDYDLITDNIIKDILLNIDSSKPTKIGIEGYSYSSNAGAIIDLVTFSTLLRKKLFDLVSEDIIVFSPSTLKLECCKLTYPPINEGKKKDKWVYKNNDGVSGGSFTKHGMLLSIIENQEFTDDWFKLCLSLKNELMGASTIPKPFEDCNDSYILYQVLKNANK
jgi:hypothetical protein